MEPANELRFLVCRVEKLERQNRFYKKVGLGLLLAVASISLMGQVRPGRTVEAEQFIVGDAQGRARATLTGDGLRFADEKGKETLSLEGQGHGVSGPSIFLSDKEGYCRVGLTLIENQPSVTVNDSQGFVTQLGSADLVTTRT